MMNWIKKKLINLLVKYILNYWKGGDKMLSKIKAFLSGKKTYLISISAIIGILVAYSNGTLEIVEAIKAIIEAILAMTIRAGVSGSK